MGKIRLDILLSRQSSGISLCKFFMVLISKQSIERQEANQRIILIMVMMIIMITRNCYWKLLMRKDRQTLLVKINVRNFHFHKILPAYIGNQTLKARMVFFSSNSCFKMPLS